VARAANVKHLYSEEERLDLKTFPLFSEACLPLQRPMSEHDDGGEDKAGFVLCRDFDQAVRFAGRLHRTRGGHHAVPAEHASDRRGGTSGLHQYHPLPSVCIRDLQEHNQQMQGTSVMIARQLLTTRIFPHVDGRVRVQSRHDRAEGQ